MEVIGAQRAQAQGEDEIYAMVDSLTRQIKEDFHLSAQEIASDIDKDVTTITTDSPQAFKEYMTGIMLHRERRFKESNEALLKAVSLDPDFALAYLKISDNYD
jgi:2-hydroxy-3-keto-5-methylthiopentenyl-1-phosphate phosphatase